MGNFLRGNIGGQGVFWLNQLNRIPAEGKSGCQTQLGVGTDEECGWVAGMIRDGVQGFWVN